MAVAFDAVGPSSAGYGFGSTALVTSGSWKHTCTGTNLLLLVDVGISNSPDTGIGVNVSYGGQSMTQVALLHSGGLTKGFLARFKLVNPPSGTNVVSVSVTGGKAVIVGGSMSFNGADQVTGVAATTYSATGTGITQSVTVTSNTSGNIIASASASGHSNRLIGSGGTRTFAVNGTLAYDASNAQAGTWAATGSSVTTSFTCAASTGWAIISNEVLTASQGTIVLPTANLQMAGPALNVNPDTYPQWFGAVVRAPLVSFAGPPSLSPVQISVSNTAGYWMFAVVSWRQDAGIPGVLQYPSTVNISDDAGNFWIPLQPGAHGTGIVRCAIWMAPAARTATQVTISPSSTAAGDAYQSAMAVSIFEYPADCPWYAIEETEFGYVNQGSSLTVTQANATTGLFSVGVVAYDNFAMPVTVSSGGWTQLYNIGGDNFVDHTGDLGEYPFFATTAGSPLSLTIARSSGGNVADLAGVIITVHGVTDAIPFPYTMPNAENWPVLITETGTGPVINANPLMLEGVTDWSVDGGSSFGTLAAVTWPAYQPYPDYQSLITPSIAMTPAGTQNICTLESEIEPVSTALRYTTLAYVYSEAGFSTVAPQIEWYDSTQTLITVSQGTPVTVPPGSWTQLSFPNAVYPPPRPSITRDQASSLATSSSATMQITWPVSPAAGSKVLVWVAQNGTAAPSLADNGTTPATWVLDQANNPSLGIFIFRADNITLPASGSFTVTVTRGGGSDLTGGGQSYTGVAAGGPSAAGNGTATSGSVTTGSVTPAEAGSLFFGAFQSNSALNPESITLTAAGFMTVQVSTDGASFQAGAAADLIATGAQACTWTLGDAPTWNAAMVAYSPSGASAAYGTASVVMSGLGSAVPASSVLYVGYCGLGVADSYENVPLDDIAWADLSARNFTQGEIEISRGIQYEQQSLEAGTMTVYLRNDDGAMMFGNILSSYWPNAGDTDVPIRLRAVWPQSITPYYVLFSGFTDQISFGWNEEDLYAYAQVEASDAWSRLTSQMLDAGVQEVLEDSPVLFCTESLSGTSIALGPGGPMISLPSSSGAGAATAVFSSNAIALPGASSLSCWESSGTGITSSAASQGVALTYFPPATESLPPVSGGVTTAFWFSPNSDAQGSQPAMQVTLCTCYSGTGPMWTIYIDNSGTAADTFAYITVYDQVTGSATSTVLGGTTYLISGATPSTTVGTYYVSVTFTQTSLTASVYSGNGALTGSAAGSATVAANLAASIAGFSLGGNAGPLYATNAGGTLGFWNVAIQNFAVFEGIVPPARIAAHVQTAAVAWTSEPDTSRLARVLGYAGATPVILQTPVYGYGLAAAGTSYGAFATTADQDPVTAITDTNGQVTSSYFTNIASSTLAFMFVNGPGVLVYRRRLSEYDRTLVQWAIGDQAAIPLNSNTLGESFSTAGWFTFSGATLVPARFPSAGPPFQFAGLMHGDGVTATPQIHYGVFTNTGVPVTPGEWYSLSCLLYSPQGWATGIGLVIAWLNSSSGIISQAFSPVVPLPAGSVTYAFVPPAQAPSGAVVAILSVSFEGTPASTVQCYVTNAQFTLVPPVTAGGAGAVTPEVPALVSAKLSSDRALMFNQAILTQFGTGEVTTYSGTSLNFQPTSGVLVTIQNNASVLQRAGVPYTATLYLQNTVQAPPYYLNEPSMEDFGNWITNTLASPLLRPDTVTITPVATPQAMQMALQAEIGDTSTFRKRTPTAAEIQILTYVSKLTHAIDIESAKWETSYELSPLPAGVVLQCDNVINGTLTGGNLLAY